MSLFRDNDEFLATNLRVEQELLHVLHLLEGFELVVFKGSLLTRMIYGDLRRRVSADNDIWVPGEAAEQALDLLLENHYQALPGLDAHKALQRLGQVALWPQGDFDQVSLDLHVEAFSSRYFTVREQTLKQNLEIEELHGHRVWRFNRYLALTHLVAHWLQHHFEEEQLQDISAAWEAWGSELSSTKLHAIAADTCSVAALELALAEVSRLHGKKAPPLHPRARIAQNLLQLGKGTSPVVRKFLAVFVPSPQKLPRSMASALFLPSEDLKLRYGAAKRSTLLLRHLWRSLN